jgi:hypothetical protein
MSQACIQRSVFSFALGGFFSLSLLLLSHLPHLVSRDTRFFCDLLTL